MLRSSTALSCEFSKIFVILQLYLLIMGEEWRYQMKIVCIYSEVERLFVTEYCSIIRIRFVSHSLPAHTYNTQILLEQNTLPLLFSLLFLYSISNIVLYQTPSKSRRLKPNIMYTVNYICVGYSDPHAPWF